MDNFQEKPNEDSSISASPDSLTSSQVNEIACTCTVLPFRPLLQPERKKSLNRIKLVDQNATVDNSLLHYQENEVKVEVDMSGSP